MITRAGYMAKRATFAEYYGQFVTPGLRAAVVRLIGEQQLLASTDEHLNDIPLAHWDMLHGLVQICCGRKLAEANGNSGVSLSDCVCVAKQAARDWIDEHRRQTS